MPAALTSTPFKIGAFTAVSSAFGAGLAAIALTYTAPADPFGGAPIFEIELYRDAGFSAPSSASSSTTQPSAPAHKRSSDSAPTQPATKAETPTSVQRNEPVSSPSHLTSSAASTATSPETATRDTSSQTANSPHSAGAPVGGDNRRGAATQGAQGGTQTDSYEAQVIRWLDERKQHPGRLDGVVTIKFEVDRRGRVRHCVITKSSGDERLDRIAQQQLRQATPLPRPPRDVTWQTREITVSLDYRRHA